MKLSIIVPVSNEIGTIEDVLKGAENRAMKVIFHERTIGKGAAIRTAILHVTGEIVLIQDADLEYDPKIMAPSSSPYSKGGPMWSLGTDFMGDRIGYYTSGTPWATES